MATMHPKWKLKTLQTKGFARLKSERALVQWKQDVKRGGTHFDRWKIIDEETYERFVEARRNNEQVNRVKYTLYIVSDQNWLIRLVSLCTFTGNNEDSAAMGNECSHAAHFGEL